MRRHIDAVALLEDRSAAAVGAVNDGTDSREVKIGPAVAVRRMIYDCVEPADIDLVLSGLGGDVEQLLELLRFALLDEDGEGRREDAPEDPDDDELWQHFTAMIDVDRFRRGAYSFLGHEVVYGLLMASGDVQMRAKALRRTYIGDDES